MIAALTNHALWVDTMSVHRAKPLLGAYTAL